MSNTKSKELPFHISVIISVYNAERFIKKTIDSCLIHDEVKEIILVDDCYPDKSIEICEEIAKAEKRVHLYKHPDSQNHGAPASWNLALSKVTQPYFAILGADDFYLSNRFEFEKQVFAKYPDAQVVYGALGAHYYFKGKKQDFFRDLTTVSRPCNPKRFFYAYLGLLYKNFGSLSLCSMTYKTDAILKNKLFFNEKLRLHQDTEFIIRTAYFLNYYSGEIRYPIAMRGIHENNRFTAHGKDDVKFLSNKLLYYTELLNWLKNEKVSFFIRFPIQIDRFYYYSKIKRKYRFLSANLLRLKFKLYYVYRWFL
jgi:glycosyltransferase involved in cell wall biosynthesis